MGKRVRLKREDDRDEPSRPEQALTVVSVVFSVLLFAYVAFQAATTPAAANPSVSVTDTRELPSGSVLVQVELRNEGGIGLLSADVEVDCDEPAASVTFQNVPADGRRVGTLVCPAGTKDPGARVASWMEA